MSNADEPIAMKLTNVSFSPDLAENLFSIRKFIEEGFISYMTSEFLYIINPKTNQVLLRADYCAPNWILIVKTVSFEEAKNLRFVQSGKEFDKSLCRVILETGERGKRHRLHLLAR